MVAGVCGCRRVLTGEGVDADVRSVDSILDGVVLDVAMLGDGINAVGVEVMNIITERNWNFILAKAGKLNS